MALEIHTLASYPNTLNLQLHGQLDALTAPELEAYVDGRLTDDIVTVVLDLKNLSFISSAGLRVFAKMRKLIKARNGKYCYVNLSPQVKKVFDIVKAAPMSEVFVNIEELDAYLKAMQDKVGADSSTSME